MLFKFIEKPITVDFFTYNAGAFHNAPIVKANKLMPEWLKSVNPIFDDEGYQISTIKNCNGFTDYFRNAVTIPMWSDLRLSVGSEDDMSWKYKFADGFSRIETHPTEQRGQWLDEKKYQHFKFVSPWAIVSNKSLKMHWTSPTWSMNKPEDMIVLPAVVDYAYSHSTNVNVVIPKTSEEKRIELLAGQPLVNLIPMTERKVIFKCHLISQEEFGNVVSHVGDGVYFRNTISRNRNNPSRCPFGFGKDKPI